MNLHNLSNENLELRLKKLVKTERKITHLVLQCIAEIDFRKIYLQKAYPSLFEFLVRGYGYSPSAAQRRIDGARLLQQIPEVAEKIESGSVNLSQVAMIQRAEREIKRETREVVSVETKRELLAQIENQTQAKTEQIIAQVLDIEVNPKNKLTQHKDESVTMTVTLSKEQMRILEQAQAMLSHALPEKNWGSLFTYLAQKEISRRTLKTQKESTAKTITKATPQKASSGLAATATVMNAPKSLTRRKPIPLPLRKNLLHPETRCSFRDPQTGKICGSQYFLQIDHIKSVSRGGSNQQENHQTLFGQHNRYKYLLEII